MTLQDSDKRLALIRKNEKEINEKIERLNEERTKNISINRSNQIQTEIRALSKTLLEYSELYRITLKENTRLKSIDTKEEIKPKKKEIPSDNNLHIEFPL